MLQNTSIRATSRSVGKMKLRGANSDELFASDVLIGYEIRTVSNLTADFKVCLS